METSLFDKTFRDREGNLVIAQMPNLPLLLWLAATLLKAIPVNASVNLHLALEAIAFGALFTWAWLELFDGVNYFRRALGLIVLIAAIASQLQWS